MASDVQNIRFRGNSVQKATKPLPARHTGILQDQLRRAQKRPWTPGFSLAIRMLFLVRVSGAMYSNIDDCDEVYNFWEPLHFLDHAYGFQTWEVSPQYAIRSWAYILLHFLPPRFVRIVIGENKRAAFFAVRIFLALVSGLAEATFYRTVSTKINERVGRYLFFMLLFSAGMWNASTAFMPSSFAMYACMFAYSYAFAPASVNDNRRTLSATLLFAAGGIIGWPFALALAIPFILEELFIFSGDRVQPGAKQYWMLKRWKRLLTAGLLASSLIIVVTGLDSVAYGKFTIVPWNIIRYNIFGGSERGPELYGTSPWNFYLLNLVLNFNVLVPLSLMSIPALGVTYVIDRKRLGLLKPSADQSSPFVVLAIRLVPFYMWLAILNSQAHKEERFMFPAYPLLCFNAAVTVYLLRGWLEVAFINITKSPYKASQSLIFRNFTFSIVLGSMFISMSRIMALWKYYHSPMSVVNAFQMEEIPRLLNVTGFLPAYQPGIAEEDLPSIDLSPIHHFELRLCYGKEWHRFPGHYLVPNGVRVDFIKSEFDGLLPRHFVENYSTKGSMWWFKPETRFVPKDLNDINREEKSRYVDIGICDYLIDLDFPKHPTTSSLEPRYTIDDNTWDRVFCEPFLDARHSFLLSRIFWVPGDIWQSRNVFGNYCLLRNRALVSAKETKIAQRRKEHKL